MSTDQEWDGIWLAAITSVSSRGNLGSALRRAAFALLAKTREVPLAYVDEEKVPEELEALRLA